MFNMFNMFVPWFYNFFRMPIVTRGQERCAEKQRPCTNTTRSSSDLADWDKATSNIFEYLRMLQGFKTFQHLYGYTAILYKIHISHMGVS